MNEVTSSTHMPDLGKIFTALQVAGFRDVEMTVGDNGDFIEYSIQPGINTTWPSHEAAYQFLLKALRTAGLPIGETELAMDYDRGRLTGGFLTRPFDVLAKEWEMTREQPRSGA